MVFFWGVGGGKRSGPGEEGGKRTKEERGPGRKEASEQASGQASEQASEQAQETSSRDGMILGGPVGVIPWESSTNGENTSR